MFYYVYIIKIVKRYFSRKPILYYVGQTNNIRRRVIEHIKRDYIGWLGKKNASKILVYVEYAENRFQALTREKEIKKYSVKNKLKLISSEKNQLINYFPFKVIILKKKGVPMEQIALKFN